VTPALQAAATRRPSSIGGFLRRYYIYLVLVIVVAGLSLANLDRFPLFERGNFLSENNIINILRAAAPLLTLAGAFTLLMVSGYIDLSVGSAMSLCAVVYATLAINGVPFLPAVMLALLLGIGLGVINGLLVVRLSVTPVIATLITLSLYKGVALLLVQDGVSAIKSGGGRSMPDWFNAYGREPALLGLPLSFWVAVAVTIALVVVQDRTILGKYTAATGGNPTAARLSGVNTRKVVVVVYILVGATAALAGIARSSFMSLGDPLSGDGMELSAILVVLLGGTAFSGGEGRVLRSFVGALIIMALTMGMLTLVPAYFQTFILGAALLAAAASNHLVSRKEVAA